MQVKHADGARDAQEPIGIVIADGGAPSAPTRFSAYVWGPVPDELETERPESDTGTFAVATA